MCVFLNISISVLILSKLQGLTFQKKIAPIMRYLKIDDNKHTDVSAHKGKFIFRLKFYNFIPVLIIQEIELFKLKNTN